MKKILLTIGFFLIACLAVAQVPQGINYQAVARASDGTVLSEENLTVRVSIKSPEEVLWQEEQDVTTNQMGLFSMVIGGESATRTGGSALFFPQISWEIPGIVLALEIDDGNGFIVLGESEINAVPYALYAASAPSSSVWQVNDDILTTSSSVSISSQEAQDDEPLFEVRNSLGVPIFAVYNDGVKVSVDITNKGTKGGFAVGGYNTATKDYTNEFLRVNQDSVRVYVQEEPDPLKGQKGGFAVGGYNTANKLPGLNYIYVAPRGVEVAGYMNIDGDLSATTLTETLVEKSQQETTVLIETIVKQQKQIELLQEQVNANTQLESRIMYLEEMIEDLELSSAEK